MTSSGAIGENLVGHGVTNTLGDANPVTTSFGTTTMLLQMDSIGQSAHWHRSLKGFLNRFDRGPTKETLESFPITLPGFDMTCFWLTLAEIHLVNIPNITIHSQTSIQYCIHKILLCYSSLSIAVFTKLVKLLSVWVLGVICEGIIPLITAFIELMVGDGKIPVRIMSSVNM